MQVYILLYIFVFSAGLSFFYLNERLRDFLVYVVIFTFGFACVFRGDVGTDTLAYQKLVDSYANTINGGYFDFLIDPGFLIYCKALLAFGLTPFWVVRSLSLVLMILFAWYYRVSNLQNKFLIVVYIIPVYFIQYGMNGLRIGVATLLFLLSLNYMVKSKFKVSCVFALLSFGIHLSSLYFVFFAGLIYIFFKREGGYNAFSLFLLFFLLGFLYFFSDYIFLKVNSYRAISSPGYFSGLAPLFKLYLMTFILSSLGGFRFERRRYIVTIIFVGVLFFIYSRFSYAGLRFLEMMAVVAGPIMINFFNIYFSRKLMFFIACFGFFSSVLTFLSIYRSKYFPGTPFNPYSFFWESYFY